MSTARIFSFLYNDQQLIDFNKYYDRIKNTVDLVQLEVELEQKLNKRVELKSVGLGGDVDYGELRTTIITNSIESQLLRSRLCHLRLEIFGKLKRLKDRVDALKKYLFIEYKPQLDQLGLKTQADKNYIIETCFLDCTNFINELEVLEQSIVYFIEDLDKNLWTLKNLVDVLEITFKSKIGV